MVRGSELAMRMLARKHGAILCYSPMLRDRDVIAAHQHWKTLSTEDRLDIWKDVKIDGAGRTNSMNETGYLMLHDTCRDDTCNLVVQLSGSTPNNLHNATTALLEMFTNNNDGTLPVGIDLNLGCPQKCAEDEGFGAFLVERNAEGAVECIASMRLAIVEFCQKNLISSKPTLSAKIRLLDSVEDTIAFARKLRNAGIDYIAIHCRNRVAKHDGAADWEAGAKLVSSLSVGDALPVIVNGGISCYTDAEFVTKQTNCHGVMVATGYLQNHRNYAITTEGECNSAVNVASEYLDYAERYPPPSYLYIQKHFRWIFRSVLQPTDDSRFVPNDYSDWRVKLWSFLVRPYIRTIHQFRLFLALYVKLKGEDTIRQLPPSLLHLVEDVTFGSVKKAGRKRLRA